MSIKTRILVISDTHANSFDVLPEHKADVLIHCGDLTDESKIEEYHKTIALIKAIDAPLKLVIGGNHDFTLDTPTFKRQIDDAAEPLERELVLREYGDFGEARRLFDEAGGITFLDEGTHKFDLQNGASMTVYASPCTPSFGGNGFQYPPNIGHEFNIGKDTDIVITHGPPQGIMDRVNTKRKGCQDLFKAVARARPRLHCFGHIHEEWGAKLVAWREQPSPSPSHFTDLDNHQSKIIDRLANIKASKYDSPKMRASKLDRAQQYLRQGYRATSHCDGDEDTLVKGKHTLFVNAAIEGFEKGLQPPWLVDIDLPAATPS
ncbi:ser/Thr protein phosphatase family protein [Nemania sp. FL0916]|nr:ser/Thr protein phosphatase family protein [Nemania sp. FL0916]